MSTTTLSPSLPVVPSSPATPPLRRWLAVFVRMIWKELRVLVPFWFVVMIAINGLSGIVVWVMYTEPSFDPGPYTLIAIAVLFPLLYAIGFGAMSYANEREEGTWDLLRRISAPSSAVCAAKLLMGLGSALLMMSFAWWAMRFYLPTSTKHSEMQLEHWMLLVAAVVGLSQMASLLTKSVLWALGLATVFSLPLGAMVVCVMESRDFAKARPDEIQALFWAIVVSGVGLIVIQFWLAQRWMLNLRPWSIAPLRTIRLLWNPLCEVGPWEASPVEWRRQFGRLVAREWLLARSWLWCSVLVAAAPLFLALIGSAGSHSWRLNENWVQAILLLITGGSGMLALLLSPMFCGVWAYQVDQRELRFRFLADRGVAPSLTWWSKQLVRLPMIGVSAVCILPVLFAITLMDRHVSFPWEGVMLVTIHVFTSYSLGQLFGQLIRSPIVAAFLACLFSWLIFGWTICVEQIHVPIFFQFAPAAILLGASYLRSRDWMEERRSLAAWGRLAASVLVPFALLYSSIGLYRMSGLPQVDRAVISKNLIRPFLVRYEPSLRHGSTIYHEIAIVFAGERAAMLKEIETLISAAKKQSELPLDPEQPNLNSTSQNEALIREIERLMQQGYLERYHAGLVSVLAERSGAVRWPLAEPLLRELHARHFSQTRQLFRTATRDSNLIWPEELYRNSCEWREFKPFSYLLALSADEAARTGRWEEAIEDTLGVWRFGRQIMRQPPQYEWTLSSHTTRLADDQLMSVAEKCRSPELIRRIIRELTAAGPVWPSSTDDVREQWASWDQTTLESILISTVHRQGMQSRSFGIMPTFLNRIFPWELSRSRRELNGLFAARLAIWEAIDAVVRDGHADRVRLIPPSPPTQTRPATTVANVKQPVAQPVTQPTALMPEERLLQQTRPLFQQSPFLSFSDKASPPINDILRREVWHRTLILRLALIAWRHEHGQLPERLEDLVGTYLERLPLDPLSGKPYLLLKTVEQFQQWAPDSNLPTRSPEWLKQMLPGIFTPSLRMGGELRVTRPDGRGAAWIEFDSPSDSTRGWGLSSPKQ